MRVNSAILCNFADVRDNLLFVMGGGITRLYRPEWPGPINICLALIVELDRNERDRPHELDVQIIDEDGQLAARIRGAFQQGPGPDTDIHEITFFPFVFDLRPVNIGHAGWHSVEIAIDGKSEATVRFRAGPLPTPALG